MTRAWTRSAREEARTVGLSWAQLSLLGALEEDGTIPVSRWIEMTGSSPSAATGLLDGLASDGHIARSRSGRDRRQVLVSLKPKGRRLARRLRGRLRQRWRASCAGMPWAQLDAATTALERIVPRMLPPGRRPSTGRR